MSGSHRKCFASIPSSFASVYLITAFFAISFLSLLYLKYPQQYINHFEYRRIVNQDPTIRTPKVSLSVNDFTAPSVNVVQDIVVNNPTTPPLFPPPPVIEYSPSISTTFVQEEKDEQFPRPPGGDSSANDAVTSSVTPTTTIVEDAQKENHDEIPSYQSSVSSPEEQNDIKKYYKAPNPGRKMATPPAAVKQTAVKREEEDQDEPEDSVVVSYDHLSNPPENFTVEERMQWIKIRLPESRIVESSSRTRKFEDKVQQFISSKRCRINIFMTWISLTEYFGKREMFSLESVLKAHPQGCVIIVSRIMASKPGRKILQPLVERGNLILAIAPDFPLLFRGTPAHDWLERLKAGQTDPGKIPIAQNLSNLLRLALLYKFGGVYFDTDMIVIKDVSGLRNSIGIQELDEKRKTWITVNNAALIFDKEHPLLFRFMEEFNSTFDGSLWGYNGPHLASRVIKNSLHDSRYQFNVMSPMAFYPVNWDKIHKFFRNPEETNDAEWANGMFIKVISESYGFHLWNKLSLSSRIEKHSVTGRLLSKLCILCQDIYDS